MKSNTAMRYIAVAVILGSLCGAGLRSSSIQPPPPYNVNSPSEEPRLFAEGIVSTDTDEFGATFSPDGSTVFFSKSVPRSNVYTICFSEFRNGKWTTPEIAPFAGQYWDFDAFFSPDGSKVFFSSDRPVPGRTRPDQDFDIWVVERTPAGWGQPRNLGAPINSDANEPFASMTADGTLYFLSSRDSQDGASAIYRARLEDGEYRNVEKLGGELQNLPFVGEVVVAPDENFMLVTPFRPDGFGSQDIYVAFNRSGAWSRPVNLGPKVNTRARDYSPRLSPDGKYLFFTSERGFATTSLERRLTFREFQSNLRSTLNGSGNIYQIDFEPLKQEALKQLEHKSGNQP